jgi:hypothetical protein
MYIYIRIYTYVIYIIYILNIYIIINIFYIYVFGLAIQLASTRICINAASKVLAD